MFLLRPHGVLHLGLRPTRPAARLRVVRCARPLSQTRPVLKSKEQEKGEEPEENPSQKVKKRKAAAKASSLRGPAVAAAQRLRHNFISKRGNTRYIDPEVVTKEINAYCAAENYNLSVAVRVLAKHGYKLDPYHTGLHKEVIHFRSTYFTSHIPTEDGREPTDIGDVFIFPSGTVVTWNIPVHEGRRFVEAVLQPAASSSVPLETEEFRYLEDPSRENSVVIGDTIVLGTKLPADVSPDTTSTNTTNTTITSSLESAEATLANETDTTLAKVAYSSGLARSTKLAALEIQLDELFNDTQPVIATLTAGSSSTRPPLALPLTRRFIMAKIGAILHLRAQLNLYSDLTDPLPDYFWDSRHELGLERYYDEIGLALDVGDRIELLNKKINYTQDIASVLREQLSERHGIRLEWIIIGLITIEVGFELYRLGRERSDLADPDSLENLLRRYLEKEMGEQAMGEQAMGEQAPKESQQISAKERK